MPANNDRRKTTLERKRKEYRDLIPQYYDPVLERSRSLSKEQIKREYEDGILHQIAIDVPRTNIMCPLFQQDIVQQTLQRLLYLWAIRHPATSYVQGINDLATPFFIVFLKEYLDPSQDPENCDINSVINSDQLLDVEADTFWCLSQLLDMIPENFTFAQPGIQRMVYKLQELVRVSMLLLSLASLLSNLSDLWPQITKIDPELAQHLEDQQVIFIQFAFRWMNCLLMRELPMRLVIRVWDTYLAEGETFSVFHVYVCASILGFWSRDLRQLEFQDIVMFLQHPPTLHWDEKEISMLLSQA